MYFGMESPGKFVMDGATLISKSDYKYLGVDLHSGSKFSCRIDSKLRSFYSSANSILTRSSLVNLGQDPIPLFYLFKQYCVPIMTYGSRVVFSCVSKGDMTRLKVAYNGCVRRIFRISRFDRVPDDLGFDRNCGVNL